MTSRAWLCLGPARPGCWACCLRAWPGERCPRQAGADGPAKLGRHRRLVVGCTSRLHYGLAGLTEIVTFRAVRFASVGPHQGRRRSPDAPAPAVTGACPVVTFVPCRCAARQPHRPVAELSRWPGPGVGLAAGEPAGHCDDPVDVTSQLDGSPNLARVINLPGECHDAVADRDRKRGWVEQQDGRQDTGDLCGDLLVGAQEHFQQVVPGDDADQLATGIGPAQEPVRNRPSASGPVGSTSGPLRPVRWGRRYDWLVSQVPAPISSLCRVLRGTCGAGGASGRVRRARGTAPARAGCRCPGRWRGSA
jgi:hypothetical protein